MLFAGDNKGGLSVPAKVVHISTVHSPHDPRICHKQCRTLAQAGFDVTLIIPGEGEQVPQEVHGVKLELLPPAQNRWQRLTKLQRLAFRKARALQADIYHFHDPELLPSAFRLKRRDNIVIYDVHEDYETAMAQKPYIPRFLAPLAALAYRAAVALLAKNFHFCLAEKYYKEKFPAGRCILNYALPSQRVPPPGLPETNPGRLLYIGNVTPERGALRHAALPRLDSEVRVHFVGRCHPKTAEKIYQIASPEQVSINGIGRFVPWPEIEASCFQRRWLAGLALFPPSPHYMRKELTKFFDYMYAEIPILCSDFPAWREFVQKYDCGIAVDPLDDRAVAEALHFLRTNPARAAEMGRNGRQAVLSCLNWQHQGVQLVEWYKELLAQRGSLRQDAGMAVPPP